MKSKVTFVDDSIMVAEGVERVIIRRKDGTQSCIKNVLYVPGKKRNLLSLGQLLERACVVKMEDNRSKVYDGEKKLIVNVPLSKNRTFKANIEALEHKFLSTTVNRDEWILHHSLWPFELQGPTQSE